MNGTCRLDIKPTVTITGYTDVPKEDNLTPFTSSGLIRALANQPALFKLFVTDRFMNYGWVF